MAIIPDLKWLENSTMINSAGVTRPVFEVLINLGSFTPNDKLGYTVEYVDMTSRSLGL